MREKSGRRMDKDEKVKKKSGRRMDKIEKVKKKRRIYKGNR